MNKIKPVPSKGFKYRIYPNKEQEYQLSRVFGSCRYIYNRLLHESIEEFKNHKDDPLTHPKPILSITEYCRKITQWKRVEETAWLKEVSSVPLQQASRHLISAFSRFFKEKKGYPKFKSKRGRQSASFTVTGYRIKDDELRLGLFDTGIKVKWSRKLPSTPRTCTVSRDPSGKYFVSFICEYNTTREQGTGHIGIDVGITDLAVMSNGEFIKNPKHFLKHQCKLRKLQRRLSKKQKRSKNRNKARIKVAKAYEKISNSRLDHLHQLTNRIVRENQAVAIEQLNVSGMIRNKKLSKHIADAGWRTFRDQLVYKIKETEHGKLVLADPFLPSTQTCSTCLTRPTVKIKLGVTKWTCSRCNSTHQRDLNAAKNLEIYLRSILKNWKPGVKILLADSYRVIA